MNLTLICKGGVNTGLGHLHRAISFIEGAGNQINFNVVAIIERGLESIFRKFPDTRLIYNEKELPAILADVQDDGVCLIDMISLGCDETRYLRKRYSRIVSLSPVFSDYSIVDVLFTRFSEPVYPPNVRVYSGLEYAIFNTHCRSISDDEYMRNLQEEHLTIAVSMGGTDAPNKTLKILSALAGIKEDLTIWVFLGEGYAHSYQDLVDTIRRDSAHEIVLVKSNRSMWKILSHCSLAILAGGLTSFEAIYAGLPTITIIENKIFQGLVSREISQKNVSVTLGELNEVTLLALQEKMKQFHANRNDLLTMRENSKGLLDSFGVQRTIEKLKHELAEI